MAQCRSRCWSSRSIAGSSRSAEQGAASRAMNPLTSAQLGQFIRDGYVRIERAFSREHADAACALLWKDTGCNPADPGTWNRPVVRLGMHAQEPFIQAGNTPVLHAAFDQLAGPKRWLPCRAM